MTGTGFESPANAQGMYHLDEDKASRIGKLTTPILTAAQVVRYATRE